MKKVNIIYNIIFIILVVSIEIISNSLTISCSNEKKKDYSKTFANYEKLLEKEKEKIENKMDRELKISNTAIDKYLEDNYNEETVNTDKKKIIKKKITCSKCNGSDFETQGDFRKHCQTKWHNYNVKLVSKGQDTLSMEEFDEYAIVNPEVLN
jgi:hypothetical protein